MASPHNTQRGLAHLAVLLIVLVVAAAGFVGWKVFAKSGTETNTVALQPRQLASTPTKKPTLPSGFVEITVEELGVRFAYPEAWGAATLKPGPEQKHLIKGNEYIVSFSKNAAVTAGAISKDWEHDPNLGHDGTMSVVHLTDKNYIWPSGGPGDGNGIEAIVYSKNEESIIFSSGFGGVGCDGVGEALIHKLQQGNYYSLGFLYIDKQMDYSGADKELGISPVDVCAKENYSKYISAENAEILKKIDSTIDNL
jgi:hypothetical protein